MKTSENMLKRCYMNEHGVVVFTSYAIELQLVIVGFHSNARTCQPANCNRFIVYRHGSLFDQRATSINTSAGEYSN